jgi:hypothetical protein
MSLTEESEVKEKVVPTKQIRLTESGGELECPMLTKCREKVVSQLDLPRLER